MKSMTGFAQKRFDLDRYSVNIALKSLNHKYLDIYFKGNSISPLIEKIFRDVIKKRLIRGKVEVGFEVLGSKSEDWNIHLDEGLLKRVLNRIAEIKDEFGNNVTFSMDQLLKIPLIFQIESTLQRQFEDPPTREQISDSIDMVLAELIACRQREGNELAAVILKSLSTADQALTDLEKLVDGLEDLILEKYVQKIKRFVKEYEIDERRVIQEAAIAVDKSCITEEIERIRVHANRLRAIINDPDDNYSKGKEMDFITQEILRETHTIGAKTNLTEVQNRVLIIRREMEKIRQQVQNVE